MEKPITETEEKKDDNLSFEELREITSPTNQLMDVLSKKSTYITESKKFEWKFRDISFSILYSFGFGLLIGFITIVLFIYYNYERDPSLQEVLNILYITVAISTVLIFTLRVFFKRGFQIFSISLMAIIVLFYFFLWLMVPYYRDTCNEIGGTWLVDDPNSKNKLFEINYTCYVNNSVDEKVVRQKSSLLEFMSIEIRK